MAVIARIFAVLFSASLVAAKVQERGVLTGLNTPNGCVRVGAQQRGGRAFTTNSNDQCFQGSHSKDATQYGPIRGRGADSKNCMGALPSGHYGLPACKPEARKAQSAKNRRGDDIDAVDDFSSVNRVEFVRRSANKDTACECDGKITKCECHCDCPDEHKKPECPPKPKPDFSGYPLDQLWRHIPADCPKRKDTTGTLWQNKKGDCFRMFNGGKYFAPAKSCDPCDPNQVFEFKTIVTITPDPVTVTEDPVTVTEDPVTVTKDPVTVTQDPVTQTVAGAPVTVATTETATVTATATVTLSPTPSPQVTCQTNTDCGSGYRCCNQWDNKCYSQCRSDAECAQGYFCAVNYWHCYPKNSQYYNTGYGH